MRYDHSGAGRLSTRSRSLARRITLKTMASAAAQVPDPDDQTTQPVDPPSWLGRLAGRFIVFDGPDGSGKSTQAARFAALVARARLTVCQVREPGGTNISERIRELLLSRDHEEMVPTCEVLLYMASRAQLVAQKIQPALGRGELVLADRFISSTLAYQGAAGGVDVDDILRIGRFAVGESWPDLVVIFDVDPQTAARRLDGGPAGKSKKGRAAPAADGPGLFADRMEAKPANQRDRIRQNYLAQAHADPRMHALIDANGEPDEVFESLLAAVEEKSQNWAT